MVKYMKKDESEGEEEKRREVCDWGMYMIRVDTGS
jgi:hypothetical protein